MENKARIQKVLSDQGILSRRRTEELIKEGRITVNGRPAQPAIPSTSAGEYCCHRRRTGLVPEKEEKLLCNAPQAPWVCHHHER